MAPLETVSPHRDVFFSPDYHDLIGLIYDAINNKDGFFPFLQRFIEVFDGHSACFAIYDLKAGVVAGSWTVNIPDHALAFYAEHVAHRDALVEAAMGVYDQGEMRFVASNLDIENVDEVRVRTRVGEFMASFGANDAAGAVAFRNDNYLNFFSIQRSIDQPQFSREQLAVFDRLLPHLNRGVSLYTEMTSLAAKAYAPERLVLDNLQQGILICDANFRVVFKNAMAERLLAEHPDISVSDQALLLFGNEGFSQNMLACLSSAIRASIEQRQLADTVLRYQSGAHNMTITVSPLAATQGGDLADRPLGGAMIGIYDWSQRPEVDPTVLQQHFGLTVTEARVAALLIHGKSLNDIAVHLNRTRETVKSHLKSLFRKTNTSRQGELVALLSVSCALI
ncbi:MAG: LuxR C-terminal-related transcriptional regulator [Marinobacter sp.]